MALWSNDTEIAIVELSALNYSANNVTNDSNSVRQIFKLEWLDSQSDIRVYGD